MKPETAPRRPAYDWGFFWAVAREHRRELVVAQLVALAAALVSVPLPLLMPLLVDEVLLDQPGRLVAAVDAVFPADWQGAVLYILVILGVTVLLRLANLVLSVWQSRQFTLIAKDATYRMRRDLLGRLGRISMAEYETLGAGAVASHFVTDMEVIDQFIAVTVSRVVVAVLTIVGTAAILLAMNWQLALFILLLNPVVIAFTMFLGKRVKDLKRRENRAFELFQEALSETLEAIQQIRAANREQHYIGRIVERARGVKEHAGAFAWKSDAASRFSFTLFLAGFDLFRAAAMFAVLFSDLSIGQMIAVFGYLWFMVTPVQELLNVQYAWYGANAALTRINGLMALRDEPQYPHVADPFTGRRTVGIDLEDVSFAYGDGPPVLRHVSLTVAPGEKVALVGASGGGKSTLVQVLLGLYPPTEGRVRYGGEPVERIGLDVVRSHVAVVLQHPALLNDSVRANLALGRPLADAALWQALAIAQLEDVVAAMPEGLDTVVGRQGVRLSGGQRQRLAIARLILADPSVVIVDEATSALDSATEARLHEALADFLEGRTTVIVAHRLSAVRQADRVMVFEDGRLAEQGSHERLLEAGGLYSRLYGELQ